MPGSKSKLLRACLTASLLMVAVGCGKGCTRRSAEGAAPRSAQSEALSAETAPVDERAAGPVTPARSPVGTNLDFLVDWSREWSFVDQFKVSRPWHSTSGYAWQDDQPLDLDEKGNVRSLREGQRARTLLMWDRVGAPAGTYVVLYDGKGRLEYSHAGKRLEDGREVKRGAGRDEVTLDPREQGLVLDVVAVDGTDPLRNLRVLMPGGRCEGDVRRWCDAKTACGDAGACVPFEKNYREQPFHPLFLERLKDYASVRFLNWMIGMDGGAVAGTWETRPKPDDVRWRGGAPVEVMVALANVQGQDPWFTIPHTADDAYVEAFALYVRDNLRPELKAYVEHSNEVWNAIFPVAKHAQEEGLRLGLSENPYEAQLRWHAQRSLRIFGIFERVFGEARKGRLVRVMGSHIANAWSSETLLSFEDAAKHTDALAVAPYFGGEYGDPKMRDFLWGQTPDTFLEAMRRDSLPRVKGWVAEQAKVAKKHGVRLVAYEGGQHLVGHGPMQEDPRVNALFDAVNRDPKMKALYLDYLGMWRAAGGELFVHLGAVGNWSKYGRWGALEWMDQPREEAPKHDALMTFIERTPRWW